MSVEIEKLYRWQINCAASLFSDVVAKVLAQKGYDLLSSTIEGTESTRKGFLGGLTRAAYHLGVKPQSLMMYFTAREKESADDPLNGIHDAIGDAVQRRMPNNTYCYTTRMTTI